MGRWSSSDDMIKMLSRGDGTEFSLYIGSWILSLRRVGLRSSDLYYSGRVYSRFAFEMVLTRDSGDSRAFRHSRIFRIRNA